MWPGEGAKGGDWARILQTPVDLLLMRRWLAATMVTSSIIGLEHWGSDRDGGGATALKGRVRGWLDRDICGLGVLSNDGCAVR